MSLDTHKRDFSTNARLPGISALAAVIGALSTLRGVRAAEPDPSVHQPVFLPAAFRSRTARPPHNTLGSLGDRRAGDRRAHRRTDGALRFGEDPRARHSRSDRSDPVRQEPHVAEGGGAQAAVVRHRDRQRRAVRRGRPDHHDGRRARLADRAVREGHRPRNARRCSSPARRPA